MKLKHSTGGRQIDVAPEYVPMYESQGWREVAKPAAKKSPAKPADKK